MDTLVLADDLTGAIEVGALFAGLGVAAPVTTELSLSPPGLRGEQLVLVVDMESRHVSAAEAAQRVERLATAALHEGVRRIYKKTDSTLRGNIGAELGALISACGGAPVVYVPAYPKLGRVCREGRLYVRGRPVAQSAVALDALNPVGESSVLTVLTAQTDLPVRVIAGRHELFRAIADERGPEILVCNADFDEELTGYAEVLLRSEEPQLAAGPAGFAGSVAGLLGLPRCDVASPPRVAKSLFVFGSLNDVSLGQMGWAREHGMAAIQVAPEELLQPGSGALEDPPVVRRVVALMAGRGHVMVATVAEAKDVALCLERGAALGLDPHATRLRVRERLGGLVRSMLKTCEPDALVVFGGDTMFGIMQACRQHLVRPIGEVLPGVPLSLFEFAGRDIVLVTKAGDFGPVGVVEDIRAFLASAG